MKNSRVAAAVGALCIVAGGLAAAPAGASFSGRNGKIAFDRFGEKTGIFTVRSDGTTDRLTRRNDSSPAWSPDGSRVAFLRTVGSVMHLLVMDADGTNRHRVGSPSQGFENGCALQSPEWSYDGLFIAYRDDCFDVSPRVAQIRVATADGSAEVLITDYGSLNHMGPQPWSPDIHESMRLTYTTDEDGDNEVMVVNSDGTEPLQLTDDEDDQFEPVWSPAGSAIVFATQEITGGDPTNSLWSIDPNGGTAVLVEQGSPHSTSAVWSPDGLRLLFARRDVNGVPTAVVTDADGSNPVVLDGGFEPGQAAWAPNGAAIAFSRNGNIVRYRLSDGRRTRLTRGDAFDGTPDWQAR